MKPHIRRNYTGKFYDGKICCHNGDVAYICTSVEDLGDGRSIYWCGWGTSGQEAYVDWKERIKCTYAKYDDEDCICKECQLNALLVFKSSLKA